MREKFLRALLSGEKTVELRRCCPKTIPKRLYLYYRRAVHGWVDVEAYTFPTPDNLQEWATKVASAACLTPDEAVKYLTGGRSPIIYHVVNPVVLKEPLPVPCRPQSWIYTDNELEKQILSAPRKNES